jgi:hypothetical protein
MLNIIMSCRLVLNLRAPQTVHTLGSDDPSAGVKLPMYNKPLPPKNFLEMTITSQSRGGITMVTDTVTDTTDAHYKY